MAESKPAAPLSPDSGPTDPHLPKLPSGWIAQWDSSSRKYYYVQISTGVSQWELPTSEAPAGPSKRPEQIPPLESEAGQELTRGANGSAADYSGDRGLGSTALHLLAGQQHGKQSSGIGGLASSFLGGGSHGSSHAQSSSSHNSGTGGLVGQLASGLLGGSKPHAQQQSHGNSTSSHQSGLSGVLGGILGSNHSSSQQQQQQQNYGYSSSGAPSGGYSGTAPPMQYTPGSSAGHTPSATGAYTPSGPQYPGQPGYNNHYPAASPQPGHAQYQAAPQSSSFGPGQPAQAYVPQGHNSFPPPPPQHQSYVASSANIAAPTQTQFGQTTQHDPSQGGYFNQPSYGQAAYGNGQLQHQPAPVASESYGTSTTHAAPPSYVQNASHSGFTQQAPQQAAYNPQSYGQPQQHNQYHATGAPPQPGW